MKESNGYAEQCKDWSDEDTACFDRHIAQAARHDWQTTTDLPPPQLIRGSLIMRYTRCGKPRCRCVTGQGHGPKYYLSVSKAGRRPTLIYVPLTMVAHVQEQLAQLQTLRTLIEELCDIGCELLTRRADT
jgi:hypothetical protein